MEEDDHNAESGVTRRISSAAASRYARPPPPVPVHRSPQPPPLQPRLVRAQPQQQAAGPRAERERDVGGLLTLAGQRRDGPRPQNEYVDSPHVTTLQNKQLTPHNQSRVRHNTTTVNNNNHHVLTLSDRVPPAGSPHSTEPVFVQPPPSTLPHLKAVVHKDNVDKEPKEPGSGGTDSGEMEHTDSIICSRCGKCRCGACTQPRELPSRWLCANKCECSAQRAVDVVSCLCCVQCVFYHSFKDSEAGEDEPSSADDPCGCCDSPHCCRRWMCLGLLSLCLPCLCLYWPLRGGLGLATALYNRCTRRGCHCRKDRPPSMGKRLLIDSESSSA
jgi:hypothetical protein